MKLTASQDLFIRRWGDMGSRWGIPRSTAMVHGLLYICSEPLAADDICDLLHIARSNVSTSLRELEDFRLIYRESHPGERRHFYTAETDVWEMARRILEERRRRETSGAVAAVVDCLQAARAEGEELTVQRMSAMLELLEAAESFALAAQAYNTSVFRRAVKMGSKLLNWIAG